MKVSSSDHALIVRILGAAGRDAAVTSLQFLGEGWDNRAVLVNEELVLRIARREVDDERLLAEARLLNAIAPRLALPVPRLEFALAPFAELPRAVMGYRLIPGTPLEGDLLGAKHLTRLSDDLAPFLEQLHGLPLEIARDADLPFFTPTEWLARHHELVEQTAPYVRQHLGRDVADRLQAWWSAYVTSPAALKFTPRLIHGDLASEHILVELSRWRVSGVIDFGDAMVADPALDLAGLPDPLARAVLQRMPGMANPDHLWQRRDAYRRLSPLHAVFAGLDRDDANLLDEGLVGLRGRFQR